MRRARFCPECGEQTKARRASLAPFASLCARCAKRNRAGRLLLVAALALCVAAGFVLGRYTSRPAPTYLVGTQVDPPSNPEGGPALASDRNASPPDPARPPAVNADGAEAACGAPTKLGRPCRRKVRGGGYCWQHRDKAAAANR